MIFSSSLIFLSLVLLYIRLSTAQDTSLGEVTSAFKAADIPTDATINFDPTVLLEVSFPQVSGSPIRVKAGEQILRNDTAIPPVFGIQVQGSPGLNAISRDTFVVAMVDLDPPTPQDPTEAQIRHFLGGNFNLERPGSDGVALLRNSTPAVSNFLQPTPPAGSDPHRYVFLLFKQSPAFNKQTEVNASTPITNFNISVFAEEVGLGSPLGGSFIRVGPQS